MKALSLKIGIIFYCVLLFSFGANKSSMEFKGDENFYFESSRYMLETGDIITPKYMDEERFQKPILFYWFILLTFKLFGVSWLSARLPSIVVGALCAFLVFRITEELLQNKKAAIISALFFATTPLCYRYARLAVPDMALVFFEVMAIYFFIRYYKNGSRGYIAAFFASLAFAFLIKGPVGAAVPIIIAGIFWGWTKERPFKFGDVILGVVLFGLIVTPWFYVMLKIYPARYANEVWTREIAQRLSWGEGAFFQSYFKGFLFYLSAFVTKFFPYSLLMPFAFRKREGKGRLFLIIWVIAVFFFFTFVPERRAHYLLALAPAVSILTALLFAGPKSGLKASTAIIALLSVVYIIINIFPPFGLFTNRMENAALIIKANIKESDAVGIGSHGIIPEELQVFFEEPVMNVKGTYTASGLPSEDTVSGLREFLNSPGRIFCVIKRRDYETFISEAMRSRLYVIGSYYVWKRRIKFDKEFRKDLNEHRFREIFQNEIYVVANKPR